MAKKGWRGDKANMIAGQAHESQSYRDQKITVKREFVAALANLSHLSVPELSAVAHSQELPALHVLMGAIVLDAIDGDSHARTILLDRLFGKVVDAVDVSHSLEIDQDLARIPEEKLVQILELSTEAAERDRLQAYDQRGEEGSQGETRVDQEARRSGDRLRDTQPSLGRGDHPAQEAGRDNGEAGRNRTGRHKSTLVEVRDSLLEVGRVATPYQRNPTEEV